jgi:hypothetical protein
MRAVATGRKRFALQAAQFADLPDGQIPDR